MSIAFLGIEIFCIGIIVFALFLLLRGDGSREQKLMQYFLLGTLVQNFGYLLELTAPTMAAALVAVKVQYLGSITVTISYCHFIFNYCRVKTPQKTLALMKLADVLVLVLIFTCDLHRMHYRNIEWITVDDIARYGYLRLEYGPGYWIFMLCGTIIPYASSIYALLHTCIRKPEFAEERKCWLILILSCLPVGALCLYILKLTQAFDPTPVVMGLVLSGVVILIWSRKVYDFSSLASWILLESMSDGVIALDEQMRIASYNPAATHIFEDLGSRAVGKQIETLQGFPHSMLGRETDIKEEFSLNGRFYQGHLEPIIDRYGKKRGYVALILDVTETRNYIEEIKHVREQAEQANVAKSAFLANMSHEIRTPMNAIVGLSDIIMEESRGRKVYEYACDIKAASRNLLSLINDILDLSKVEAGKMELVPTEYHVKTLVNEVLNMMDVVASQRGLLVKSEFDMSIPCRYLGDEGRIKQILINILNNALKFTKEGYVKISVTGVKQDGADIERLVFRIEDTGCGIKEEDIKGIFENFKQIDSKRNRTVEGTGLGLSITKHLIELMQGTIQVESEYGKGSTFTVEIPQKIVDKRLLSEVPEAETIKEWKLEPFVAKDYKVLVVDDNMVNRKVARIMLQSYGMEVHEASGGQAAIALVKETRYDIIFMDHMMPEMDGIETVQVIRSECGENGRLPVIIALTANAMEGVRETFLKSGFQDFVTKPLDRKPLHEVLLRWIPEERRTASKEWVNILETDDSRESEFQNILIEGIDMDEVVKHYSGSAADYRELLSLYCLDGKRKLVLLRELWEKHDYKNYGIEVHGLKSASANIGAMKIFNSARKQENAVNRGDETFVDEHVLQLLTEYEAQIRNISIFLEREKKSGGAGEKMERSAVSIEMMDLVAKLQDALDSLENFRAKDCAHKIKELMRYELLPDVEAELTEIQELLKLYEDDAAEQRLRELIIQNNIDKKGDDDICSKK